MDNKNRRLKDEVINSGRGRRKTESQGFICERPYSKKLQGGRQDTLHPFRALGALQ